MDVDKDRIERLLSLTQQQRDVIDDLDKSSAWELPPRLEQIGFLNERIGLVLMGILGRRFPADDKGDTGSWPILEIGTKGKDASYIRICIYGDPYTPIAITINAPGYGVTRNLSEGEQKQVAKWAAATAQILEERAK